MIIGRLKPSRLNLKSKAEIAAMRHAGTLASQCLHELLAAVKPGVTTQDLDDLQMAFARKHNVIPAPLGYKGYPKSICTSINEVICHGIPSAKEVLRQGDIICVDVTLIVDGFHADNAATIGVGEVDPIGQRLMEVTLESLRRAIETVSPTARLGDIGHAIQSCVEPEGFSVVRDFVGHGVGKAFHEPPHVQHFGQSGMGQRLREGMTFTIEPMINEGTWRAKVLEDGWTAVTTDGMRSAQYEHTIAVTGNGVSILTVQNDEGAWEPPGRCLDL